MSELVEGARLESVCMGNCTKGSNPFLSATFRVGSRAIGSCEPRQIRKEATVSNVFGVPRITQLFFYSTAKNNLTQSLSFNSSARVFSSKFNLSKAAFAASLDENSLAITFISFLRRCE